MPAQPQIAVKPTHEFIADVVHSSTESVPNSLQIIVPDRSILDDTQCDFASGVCVTVK